MRSVKAAKLQGLQAASDPKTYRVWQRMAPDGGAAQRYLVNEQGVPVYLVDPGINGTHRVRPDGSAVQKFDAPKATLMSVHHQRHPQSQVAVGACSARRNDCGRA